jgi:membrane-bound acyltransferase YfiQ involved in biofilm formation
MRRLSALGLLVIFNAAVYPFGRVDLIGHALIMMMIVAIAVDHTRELHFLNAIRRRTALLPISLAGFMAVFAVSYWGLHEAIYGMGEAEPGTGVPLSTHSHDPENPHPTAQ